MMTQQIFIKPSLTALSLISPFSSLRLSNSHISYLYEWLGDGLTGLAEDVLIALRNPTNTHLYMTSLQVEMIEAFNEYWMENSGNYEHPETKFYEFIMFLPRELRLLQAECMALMTKARALYGDVTLIHLQFLAPDDTIVATFKPNRP